MVTMSSVSIIFQLVKDPKYHTSLKSWGPQDFNGARIKGQKCLGKKLVSSIDYRGGTVVSVSRPYGWALTDATHIQPRFDRKTQSDTRAQRTAESTDNGVDDRKKLEPAIGLHFPYEWVTECARRTNFLVVSVDTTVRIQNIRKFVLSTNFFLDS